MYWFSSLPYLRYAVAAILVVAAVWVELRPRGMVEHPFAVVPIPAGAALERSMFEFRDIPAGVLEAAQIGGTTRHSIAAGNPLLPGDVDPAGVAVPRGWWTVEVALPLDTQPGDLIRLVVRPYEPGGPSLVVDGIAVGAPPAGADPFGLEASVGRVALPEDTAAEVAVAAGDHRLTVLVRKPSEVAEAG